MDSWSGSFQSTLVKVQGEMIDVTKVIGNVITAIPLGASTVQDSIVDASTIITDTDSFATLIEKLGSSEVKLSPKTILTRLPIKNINQKDLRTFTLMRGKIDSIVNIKDRDFKVVTPVGVIEVIEDIAGVNETQLTDGLASKISIRTQNTRNDGETTFSTEYSQNGTNGTVTVSVDTGMVVVTAHNGDKSIVSSGQEKILTDSVSRTTWVQPADGGSLYSDAENLLSWTIYPGADSYLIEYNLPTPVFAEDNTVTLEYQEQSLHVTTDMYTEYDGLVLYYIDLSGMPKVTVESRVYALDSLGNILSDSVSSDRATMIVN